MLGWLVMYEAGIPFKLTALGSFFALITQLYFTTKCDSKKNRKNRTYLNLFDCGVA